MSAYSGQAAETVITLCDRAARLHRKVSQAYDRIGRSQRERPGDDGAMREAQAWADVLGRRYERLCERIYKTEARTLEGVLAKLRCATRCIRDIVPEGKDPERVCDIELRFVFAWSGKSSAWSGAMKKTYPSGIGKARTPLCGFRRFIRVDDTAGR